MWIKKLRKRKLQSSLIILIIMVCSMLMTSSLVIMTSWKKPYETLTKECKSPVIKLYLFNDVLENVEKVQSQFEGLKEVEAAEIIEYKYLRDKVMINEKEIEGFFDLVLYNNKLHENIRMISGGNALKDSECLVPAVLANDENIKVGNIIKVGYGLEYKVVGIYTEPYNMSISFDTEILVNKIPKELDSSYYLSVFSKNTITGTDLIDIYRENNNKILEGRAITLEARISNNQMTEQILGGILLVMSMIILLVSGIMIQYMIKNTLLSEKKTIAIYKTIGFKNSNIIGIYMKSYLLLVLIGSFMGALLSKFISDSFTRITFRNLGVTNSSNTIVAGIICVAVIVAYVILQVYLVINKTKKIKPMEVFRGESTIKIKRKKGKNYNINFSPLSMALRMITREKKNTVIIVITCIMSAYCVNFAATAITMMKGMADNNYYWIGFDKHDVSADSLDLDNFDEAIEKLRGVKSVDRVVKKTTDVAVSIEWKKGIGDTIISSMVYENFNNMDMPVLEGRNPVYNDEIALGNAIAEKLNKHIGDYIDIYFNGDHKVTLMICGTYQSYYDMGKSCRMIGSTLEKNNIAFRYSEGSVYLKDNYSVREFLKEHSDGFSNTLKLIDRKDKYRNIMNMITGPQMVAIKPFMALALLLGGLNIVAIIYLKNKDQSKINSIYKSLGYSSRHLLKANTIYVLIIAATSILVTVPLFMVVFPKTMVLSMSMMGFKKYIASYDIGVIIFSNLCALIIYIVSGLVSSKSLYNNPIEDLKCE